MDFFQSQEVARKKTGLLVAYFVLAVILIIVTVYLAIAAILQAAGPAVREGAELTAPSLWDPQLFGAIAAGTTALIAGGSLYKIAALSSGGHTVAELLGGRLLHPQTSDLNERKILNVVEEMAIAAGTPVPPVYLLENEDGINAFAAGHSPNDAVIGVTRGCIQTLSRDELQGVIAHEFSHILNGDMRLDLRLMGVLFGILLIGLTGYILLRSTSGYGYRVRVNSRDDDRGGRNVLPLIGLALYIIGYIGVFFANLIKAAVSRQREFLADASAVQFTRNPDGIAGRSRRSGRFLPGRPFTSRGPRRPATCSSAMPEASASSSDCWRRIRPWSSGSAGWIPRSTEISRRFASSRRAPSRCGLKPRPISRELGPFHSTQRRRSPAWGRSGFRGSCMRRDYSRTWRRRSPRK